MKESQKKESFVLKDVILFTIVFTIINICIYYHIVNSNECIDFNTKTYIIIFYVICLIYMIYLYRKNSEKYTSSITISPSSENIITMDLTKNPEYNSNSSKVIYWGIDFNVNGMVDIINGKVTIPINNKASLKYRIIDINEKLSNIYDVI